MKTKIKMKTKINTKITVSLRNKTNEDLLTQNTKSMEGIRFKDGNCMILECTYLSHFYRFKA